MKIYRGYRYEIGRKGTRYVFHVYDKDDSIFTYGTRAKRDRAEADARLWIEAHGKRPMRGVSQLSGLRSRLAKRQHRNRKGQFA